MKQRQVKKERWGTHIGCFLQKYKWWPRVTPETIKYQIVNFSKWTASINLYRRSITNLWYLYMVGISLRKYDIRCDLCARKKYILIPWDIVYKSSWCKTYGYEMIEITRSSQVVAICYTHNNLPFNLTF